MVSSLQGLRSHVQTLKGERNSGSTGKLQVSWKAETLHNIQNYLPHPAGKLNELLGRGVVLNCPGEGTSSAFTTAQSCSVKN